MMKTKIIYIDMDGVLCNFDKAFLEKYKFGKIEYPQSTCNFFLDLEEIEDSNYSVRELNKNWDIRIATSPSVKNPWCYTEKRLWIEKHYGDINLQEKLYIIPDKSVLIGDYLIDDRTEGNGQDKFKGTLINFGSPEYKNWNSVLDFFFFVDKSIITDYGREF